jgi:hypothetical protein
MSAPYFHTTSVLLDCRPKAILIKEKKRQEKEDELSAKRLLKQQSTAERYSSESFLFSLFSLHSFSRPLMIILVILAHVIRN